MVLGNDTWNLEPPPSFQGLREDLPIKVYQRNLPHWRQSVATYFVSFRLADSIPQECLELLKKLRAEWATQNPPPHSRVALDQLARILYERSEYWLDQRMGSCILQDVRISRLVDDSLKHFHQTRYELRPRVIMSNHVHCIVRPLPTVDIELEDILGNLKAFSAKQINGILDQSGVIWQQESDDRIIRDPEHLWRCLQYIGHNPTKAGRSGESCRLWVNPQWEEFGWVFAK